MTKQQIFYNGFDIIMENCRYKIKGLDKFTFHSLTAVKAHIDWMKLDKPHTQTPINLKP